MATFVCKWLGNSSTVARVSWTEFRSAPPPLTGCPRLSTGLGVFLTPTAESRTGRHQVAASGGCSRRMLTQPAEFVQTSAARGCRETEMGTAVRGMRRSRRARARPCLGLTEKEVYERGGKDVSGLGVLVSACRSP